MPPSLESLGLFSHLSSLSISPCEKEARDAILAANFNLTRFSIGISRYEDDFPLDDIVTMLAASALKTVETFLFQWKDCVVHDEDLDEWTEEAYAKFIGAISTNFQSLQTIALSMPFRKSCFQHLRHLSNIKSVSWQGFMLDVEDTGNNEIAQTAVQDAFVGFEKLPECKTTILRRIRMVPVTLVRRR
jgi:hypothetical protein